MLTYFIQNYSISRKRRLLKKAIFISFISSSRLKINIRATKEVHVRFLQKTDTNLFKGNSLASASAHVFSEINIKNICGAYLYNFVDIWTLSSIINLRWKFSWHFHKPFTWNIGLNRRLCMIHCFLGSFRKQTKCFLLSTSNYLINSI